MECPRCSYECDVRQSPCPRCSFYVPASGLRRSSKSQVPMSASLPNDFVASPPTAERTAQARSVYRQEFMSGELAQAQSPVSLHKLQLSNFPLPSTGKLDPKRTLVPLADEPHASSVQQAPFALRSSSSREQADMEPLLPGTLLHRDRYSLQKNLHKQEWPLGIVETIWSAFDTRVVKSFVLIYELSMPNDVPREAQEIAYSATKVFTSIGRNAHVLPLRDVFGDKGRSFFVFEPVDGFSLSTLMFNSGKNLPEKEVVTCCLQLVELLDLCSQQSPPLIHGNIRPEYVVKKSIDSQYVLTNFSVALAGGLAQIVADRENVSLSPYTGLARGTIPTGSLMKGKMDGRTDLYALLAMAHYAVRGYWLPGGGGVSSVSAMEASSIPMIAAGPDLSPQLRAILLKGLRAPLHQRYQRPSELYQDLFLLYKQYQGTPSSSLSEQNTQPPVAPMMQAAESEQVDFAMPSQPGDEPLERVLLVPLPEELPPLREAHDMRNAVLWFVGMLFCLVLLLGHHLIS
jgi:hypothetical protein